MDFKQWRNFNTTGEWTKEIDVRGFIQANYTPYEGDSNFLTSPTEKTKKLWNKVLDLYRGNCRISNRCSFKKGYYA